VDISLILKAIDDKRIANIILDKEKTETISPKSGIRQG
jgi:hypothetical protein